MKISNVSTMLLGAPIPPERQWRSDFGQKRRLEAAIVVVETDEGITGYGEAKGSPRVVEAIVASRLKPLLIGEDPRRITYLWEKMYSGSRLPLALKYGRPYQGHNIKGETMCAMSGVDVALWDITGKALGVPIHALLGGAVRERIRAYGSGGWASRVGRETSCGATWTRDSPRSRCVSVASTTMTFPPGRSPACGRSGRRSATVSRSWSMRMVR